MNKKEIIRRLKEKKEIEPDEYDGSYELVRETARGLGNIHSEDLTYKDLDLLYLMTVKSDRDSLERKKERVRDSHLKSEDKEKLADILNKIKQKSEAGEYKTELVGIFGTGFRTFNRGSNAPSTKEVEKVVNMCNELIKQENEEKCIKIIENYLTKDIYNLRAQSISQILHCLKPFTFPIINNPGIELYQNLGIDLVAPNKITTLAENVRKIKEFRDKNFNFKNYRVIDEINDNSLKNASYWKLSPGKGAEHWEEFEEKNYIAIGWPKLVYGQGNLEKQINKKYPEKDTDYIKKRFKYFVEEMAIGDKVLIWGRNKILGIAEVVSEHYLDEQEEHYKNKRDVNWLIKTPIDAKEYGKDFYNKLSHQFTIFPIKEEEYIKKINEILTSGVKDVKLSDPFTNIFRNAEEAYWFFDILKEIADVLEIEEPNDERLVITFTDGKRKLRLNFCPWAIFHIEAKAGGKRRIGITLFEKAIKEELDYETFEFSQDEEEPSIKLYKLAIENFKENEDYLRDKLKETLEYIKERFKTHSRSSHRGGHRKKIGKAVFSRSVLKEVLAGNWQEKAEVEVKMNVEDKNQLLSGVDFSLEPVIDQLYFPKKNKIINRIKSALKNGKHIILTGPPGTGKSKLAKEICESYVGQNNYKMVTATSNWSTFDTIGGYQPNKDNELEFNSGVFLDRFKKEDGSPDNQWLIIDEINRADIDKSFGSLFSVLTGDQIILSFKTETGKNIVVRPQKKEEREVVTKDYEYILPQDWRLIATMNTLDKASLYEMSYAFMRRFAFIPISIPEDITSELIKNYLDCWELEDDKYSGDVASLWAKINDYRKIGPALVKDIYCHLIETSGDYASALIMYVLPQFEGVRDQQLEKFLAEITNLEFVVDKDEVNSFAEDYFQLEV